MESGWNKLMQQLAVVASFTWAIVGTIQSLDDLSGTALIHIEMLGWRLAVASFISLASIALFRSLLLIDRSLSARQVGETSSR
jgi:hypothetical protein